jgi:hypothetical protein
MRTTGATAGNIIAAIIATHAIRKAMNDIVCSGWGSIGIGIVSAGSPAILPALTADHHHPRPARSSSVNGGQMSLLPAAPRISRRSLQSPLIPLWQP